MIRNNKTPIKFIDSYKNKLHDGGGEFKEKKNNV